MRTFESERLITLYPQEREKATEEQAQREKDIALGNPLLMPMKDTVTKRRSACFLSCCSSSKSLTESLGGMTMWYSGIRLGEPKTKARRNLST